jgi:hypothetical protein
VHAQLVQYRANMVIERLGGTMQLLCELRVATALREQLEYLHLFRGQTEGTRTSRFPRAPGHGTYTALPLVFRDESLYESALSEPRLPRYEHELARGRPRLLEAPVENLELILALEQVHTSIIPLGQERGKGRTAREHGAA